MHELDAEEEAERAAVLADGLDLTRTVNTDDADLQVLKKRGYSHMQDDQFDAAINEFSMALKLVRDPREETRLLNCRCDAFLSMCRVLRLLPAEESERGALYGLDPLTLAQLALKDASKIAAVRADWPMAHRQRGCALFYLERFEEAQAAFLEGLSLDPADPCLQGWTRNVRKLLAEAPGRPGASGRRVAQCEDTDCSLCMKLLYEPVTTPCGHTFCRACFARCMDHSSRCPMCRTVLHAGRELNVTRALHDILEKSFPEEYAARKQETLEASPSFQGDASAPIPLFVMSCLLPGERMALNIFEPRYRLMVRRCMEGNRRFGMAVMEHSHVLHGVACEAEIVECQPQPDGRFYLEVVARRRFRILSSWEQDGYRMAQPRFFHDDVPAPGSEEAARTAELATHLSSLADDWVDRVKAYSRGRRAGRLLELLHRAGDKPPMAEPERLSFWAANIIPMEDRDRLHCLSLSNTAQRITYQKSPLEQAINCPSCAVM